MKKATDDQTRPKNVEEYMDELGALSDRILELTSAGDEVALNDMQRLFFSVVRDCAFKIKQELKKAKGEV